MIFDADDERVEPNDYYSAYPSTEHAWIYIAVDIRNMNITKVGLTTKEQPKKRIAEGKAYNPFITLFTTYELSKCTYGVSRQELSDIEKNIHNRSVFGEPIKHLFTRRDSEWFHLDPEEAEYQVDSILAKRGFSVDGKSLYASSECDISFHGIHVPRMRKIKTAFRPDAREFHDMARASEIPYSYYRDYYTFLEEYHSRPAHEKPYD